MKKEKSPSFELYCMQDDLCCLFLEHRSLNMTICRVKCNLCMLDLKRMITDFEEISGLQWDTEDKAELPAGTSASADSHNGKCQGHSLLQSTPEGQKGSFMDMTSFTFKFTWLTS